MCFLVPHCPSGSTWFQHRVDLFGIDLIVVDIVESKLSMVEWAPNVVRVATLSHDYDMVEGHRSFENPSKGYCVIIKLVPYEENKGQRTDTFLSLACLFRCYLIFPGSLSVRRNNTFLVNVWIDEAWKTQLP